MGSTDKSNNTDNTDPGQPDLDVFVCPRCLKSVPYSAKGEHQDWHLAQDLQSQEEHQPTGRPAAAAAAATQNQQSAYSQAQTNSTSHQAAQTRQRGHTNAVIEAGIERARDEQYMQNQLQSLQYQYGIYNSDIEPEHEVEYYCMCPIHQYMLQKWQRYGVQKRWSQAVMYPGEKAYNDDPRTVMGFFNDNPYLQIVSPYGNYAGPFGYSSPRMYQPPWSVLRPLPRFHAECIHQTIRLNNALNAEALRNVEANEPKFNIWDEDGLEAGLSTLTIADTNGNGNGNGSGSGSGKPSDRKDSIKGEGQPSSAEHRRPSLQSGSKFSNFRRSIGIRTSEEKVVRKNEKRMQEAARFRREILQEENGRWPDEETRRIAQAYQEKIGMARMVASLRATGPIQYLHLLRAGYFEPIPVAWAYSVSNPLKFSIEPAAGWRGITPAWRGYEDTAEERLYWVLNHREGSVGMTMKPDMISALNMARERMAHAVEPPPEYFDATDTCYVQHTSEGQYSKQVMPRPFVAYDRPELPTDDTMILLDVSGSMDFDPVRPIYDQYMITGYAPSTQPKNKDVARAIIRRFTDAMSNHDHSFDGYDLVTFANEAQHLGKVNHQNLGSMWQNRIRFGGGTRVMTGWQKVKELHFQKHSESATHHREFGWQAGPDTPILRLLLLLDGEATDMDEFELDLLSLSWAHVTIFLIGVDGCPHHHRHANELQRISDVNHHVSFVDAQGNMPERFVTHELLKRHLGYAVTMEEFQQLEQLPAYSET